MKHYPLEAWTHWINEQISQQELDEMEQHLSSCDECLSVYMLAMELNSSQLPHFSGEEEEASTQYILDRSLRSQQPSSSKRILLHYTVAAAATLILVASGFFQQLTQEISHIQTNSSSTQQEQMSISQTMLDHTLTWLDKLQSKTY
ncbi:hypothetical protein D3C73_803330 [compost metagenome]